tara:strand:+ start:554 stop:757 length:204 start_codon:yes stop_codon:yes gene_type:complete
MATDLQYKAPEWLGDEVHGEKVIAWRMTKWGVVPGVYHYQIITEGSIFTAKADGTLIGQALLTLVGG